MKKILLAAFGAALLPITAVAQDQNNYLCTHGDLQRRVEILYETGVTVPCEVHYFKDTEAPGESEVLWRALSQEGYCEEKTRDFITQLGAWGWSCNQNSGVAPAMPAEPAAPAEPAESAAMDDTEALAPAEEPEPR